MSKNIKVKDLQVGDKILIETTIRKIDLDDAQLGVCIHDGANFGSWINTSIIKEVTEKPFDWADCKPGFAFKDYSGGLCWFVGWALGDVGEIMIVTDLASCDCSHNLTFRVYGTHKIVRSPKHDLEA